jgi:hypothetical protein
MTGPSNVGSVGEEAALLIDAAQVWIRRAAAEMKAAPIATGTPECAWCPLCQVVSMLRSAAPDAATKLGEVQLALSGLLRALADAMNRAEGHGHGSSGDSTASGSARGNPGREASSATSGRVLRIDLDDGQTGAET